MVFIIMYFLFNYFFILKSKDLFFFFFFFQAEDGIRDLTVTGVQTCALPICHGAVALGMTRSQAMRRIILPQAVMRMVPPMAAMWVALFKDTSILATIGVVELMYQARYLASDTFRPLEIFTVVALIYFALTYPQSLGVNRLYERFRVRE